MIKLSVAIITYNEEANILRCIESLQSIADEIVVVDSFSKDNTIELAHKAGARVITNTFQGHIEQKNFAITQCNSPYILSLDADEALTPLLQQEILHVKANWKHDGYYLNRCTRYCGQWIRHGDWYPDYKLRLWDSRKGKWTGQNPHDKYEMEPGANMYKLRGELLHFSYNSISEHLQQMDKFTTIAAQALFTKGRKVTFIDRYIKPHYHFIKAYYLKAGFLDGWQGLTVARLSAMERVVRFSKLDDLYRLKEMANDISDKQNG